LPWSGNATATAKATAPADGRAATVRVKRHPSPALSGGGTRVPSSRPHVPHLLPSFLFLFRTKKTNRPRTSPSYATALPRRWRLW
jgi:hypothetical protein